MRRDASSTRRAHPEIPRWRARTSGELRALRGFPLRRGRGCSAPAPSSTLCSRLPRLRGTRVPHAADRHREKRRRQCCSELQVPAFPPRARGRTAHTPWRSLPLRTRFLPRRKAHRPLHFRPRRESRLAARAHRERCSLRYATLHPRGGGREGRAVSDPEVAGHAAAWPVDVVRAVVIQDHEVVWCPVALARAVVIQDRAVVCCPVALVREVSRGVCEHLRRDSSLPRKPVGPARRRVRGDRAAAMRVMTPPGHVRTWGIRRRA